MLRVVARFHADEDSIVAPGDDREMERKVREIASDSFGLWALRDLLSRDTTSRSPLGMKEDDVVVRVSGGVKEGKYVFVRKGGVRTALPPPLPPPVSAPPPKKEEPKKVAEKKPWKLDVTVFTNSKSPWPKGTVTVSVRGPQGGEQTTKMTANRATALSFTGNHDSPHEYEVKASAPGWDGVASVKVQLKNEDAKTCEVELAPPKVHLRLSYEAPDAAVRPFPKDFALKVEWDDASTKDVKVEDEKGYVAFDLEKGKTKFTLKFDHAKTRYLVHAKADGGGAGKPSVEEDPTDDALRTHTTDGKLFFALPRTWSLVHAKWDAAGVTVPQDGKVVLPDEGIGTKDAPAHLTLVPKCQYVRFEFHDRKYWKDHAVGTDRKRVSIPSVVLKGARKSDAAGAPTTPVAGTHDAVSNWVVERDDAAKTCQALPWVVTRKPDGADLPKLDKEMLLEWGWEKGFVHSKSKTERVVVTLEPADDKRKPSKDRSQWYDLPKLWKSKCWWTRTSDATKNGFFDELTPEVIELSLTKATPMTFSLDDIVLVDAAGTSQAVKDSDRLGTAADLSEHSRVAILHLDAEDGFKVKVFDPRAEDVGVYHSKSVFQADASARVRNVLISYPDNPRVVVFCNAFHDVWDKRTETADFAKKEILGARAARPEDADVSGSRKFDQGGDVGAGYVHRTRVFDLHYLHYGATDGTTVYSALVTHWSAYVFSQVARKPAWVDPDPLTPLSLTDDIADARRYRGHSLARAMTRWNEKDYQFEEADGKTDLVVKALGLFEAKEVEDPPGTWHSVGGVPHCVMAVGTDPDDSWATDTQMLMAKDDHDVEADWASEVRKTDYDGVTRPRRVMAHELGHAAIGLWDDYITQKWKRAVPGYESEQRYPGVPYFRDEVSMMRSNRSTRLRMYWGRANWMHDDGAAAKPLHKFLGARRWKITWAPAGKTKFAYTLDEGSRNIYAPTHRQADYGLGEQGKADMLLYKLGDDEFARQTKGGPYNGILVVEMRLCAAFTIGLDPAVAQWETATAYAVSDLCESDGKFHVCVDAHTSAADFATDLGASRWFELDPAEGNYNWVTGTDYTAREWVEDGGVQYVCRKDHKSGSFIDTNYVSFGTDHGAWAAGSAYADGDVVNEGGQEYVCIAAHGSGGAFAGDAAQWLATSGTNHGDWADGQVHSVGDEVKEGGVTRFCRTAHTAGSVAADVDAGRLVSCGSSPSKWKDAEIKDWIVAANKSVVDMLEGDEGKFKLTKASGDFSATYLRMFAQWQTKDDAADANPARTQFECEVVKGGAAKYFYPAAETMKVGSETDNATIVRYLFGKLSDVAATRKNQDKTSALTLADLGKLKDWMQSKAGGTFAVADVT